MSEVLQLDRLLHRPWAVIHGSRFKRVWKENMKNKEQAIINFVLNWLNSNIDDRNASASDSLDLKEKIEMALDPQITIEDIAKGNF